MEGAMEVPLFPYALFRLFRSVLLQAPAFICSHCPSARIRQKGRNFMKIKMRYEDAYQTLEVETKEIEKWLNISISEEESQEDYEKRVQDEIEVQFNRPDYNNWHKFDRHRGYSKAKPNDETDGIDTSEPLIDEVRDSSVFYEQEINRNNKWEYEAVCQKVREILKPDAADMVIAIALDGYTVGEYAELIGDDANNVSHRYRRAIKKLKKVFSETSF
jgi:hypothetical protein